MITIVEWKERYEVSFKGFVPKDGEEFRVGPLQYIRLKVHGHSNGTGMRRLKSIAGNRAMEVFGIFCKFLEIAGNQRRELRGSLLNEKGKPATAKDLAFILDIPEDQVEYAIQVLCHSEIAWMEKKESTKERINSTQHKITHEILEKPEISGISGKSSKKFIPPTLDEVKKYITDNPELSNIDPEGFLKYFTDGNWIDSKGNKVQCWKQKVRTWSSHDTGGHNRPSKTDQAIANLKIKYAAEEAAEKAKVTP